MIRGGRKGVSKIPYIIDGIVDVSIEVVGISREESIKFVVCIV